MAYDLASVTNALEAAGCVAARDEAEELITAARGDHVVLGQLLERRALGEPVAWMTEKVVFCDLQLHIQPNVYVPRWQTEPLARRAATLLPESGVALDLCTGSGAIAAFLQSAVPSAQVLATEIDPVAASCARRNGVEVYEGFLDEPVPGELEGAVDVITAVVPYVPTGEIRLLPRDVREFEPLSALDGGPDGTDYLVRVIERSAIWLRPGGWMLLELGGDQAEAMGKRATEVGFDHPETLIDDDTDVRGIVARLGR